MVTPWRGGWVGDTTEGGGGDAVRRACPICHQVFVIVELPRSHWWWPRPTTTSQQMAPMMPFFDHWLECTRLPAKAPHDPLCP